MKDSKFFQSTSTEPEEKLADLSTFLEKKRRCGWLRGRVPEVVELRVVEVCLEPAVEESIKVKEELTLS